MGLQMIRTVLLFFINVKLLYLKLNDAYSKPLLKLYSINYKDCSIEYIHIKTHEIFVSNVSEYFICTMLKNFGAEDCAQIGVMYAKWHQIK
jgi:hypothetical protein